LPFWITSVIIHRSAILFLFRSMINN
jgi:hypothetical protein